MWAGAPSCWKIISDIFEAIARFETEPRFAHRLNAALQVFAKMWSR